MDKDKKEKGLFDYFKAGFKPTATRADDKIRESRENGPNQLDIDLESSRDERIRKFKSGFYKR